MAVFNSTSSTVTESVLRLWIPLARYKNEDAFNIFGAGPPCAMEEAMTSPATTNSSLPRATILMTGKPFWKSRLPISSSASKRRKLHIRKFNDKKDEVKFCIIFN